MSALCSYDWPGNIRELQNLIERAVILSDDGVLSNPLPAAGHLGDHYISGGYYFKRL